MSVQTSLLLHSFRGRLALCFGGLSLLVLLSVGLYFGHMATQQLGQAAREKIHSAAQAAADLLGANLRERELEIALLSMAPHFTRGDLKNPELLESLQRRKLLRREFAWLGVADVEGQVLQASDGLLAGVSVAQRPWFMAAMNGVYVGDLHEAKLLAKLMPQQADGEPPRFIDFAAPIRDRQGRLVGVVGAHAHWNWVTETVQSTLAQRQMGGEAEILIVDKSGNVLYPRALAGNAQLPRGVPEGAASSVARWNDGIEYLSSEVPVRAGTSNDLGWRIVVRQSIDLALAPAHELRRQLLALGLAAALLATLVAIWLARSISRPIEQLATAARRVQQRSDAPRYPASGGLQEIDQLSEAMRSMTDSLLSHERELEALNQTLEQQVQQRTEALAAANAELERLATRDALTGLANRRSFDERLLACFQTARRTGRGFALLLLDADHFKRVNDQHGHTVGDQVLQQLGQLLKASIRSIDLAARYGGEEFAVLLPETAGLDEAAAVADKIRAAVALADFPAVGRMTISVGVASWHAADTDPLRLVQRADKGLYAAKGAGRNQVMVEKATT